MSHGKQYRPSAENFAHQVVSTDSDRFSFDQVGTYSELLANEGAFSEFLKTFAAEQNVEEDGR